MDIKELATLTAAEMDDVHLRNVPAIVLEQYCTRLIAAYMEGQEPAARSLPEKWELGMRVRFLRHKEWAWNAGTEATVVELSNDRKDRRGDEYQVFWTEPDGGGAIWWTTPDDVELLTPNVSSTAPPEPAPVKDSLTTEPEPSEFSAEQRDKDWSAIKSTAPSSEEVARMVEKLRLQERTLRFPGTVGAAANLIERLAARVPDGCVVVQREPTEAMCQYLCDCDDRHSELKGASAIYKAMIAAGEVKP